MRKILFLGLVFAFLVIFVQTAAISGNYNVYTRENFSHTEFNPKERIEFIVDFSNSMTEKIHGERKIDMAISTLEKILKQIPRDIYVGFRSYGHRAGITYFDSCKASKQIAPVLQNNTHVIQASMYQLSPHGATPITFSLKRAVERDFAGYIGPKRIILLTDGGENCDESPCDFALKLIKERSDFRIDVIALDLYDKEAINQLKCTALATNGKFYSANTAAELLNSFQDTFSVEKDVQGVVIP